MKSHLERGGLGDGLVNDGVCLRLIEIGEAVKGVSAEVLAAELDIPWADVAGMRDWQAHHYFDTTHALVHSTVTDDLPSLDAAVRRLDERREGKRPSEAGRGPRP